MQIVLENKTKQKATIITRAAQKKDYVGWPVAITYFFHNKIKDQRMFSFRSNEALQLACFFFFHLSPVSLLDVTNFWNKGFWNKSIKKSV